MAFSEMSTREKVIVGILAAVIVIALVGIGLLVARLVTGDQVGEEAPAITATAATVSAAATPEVTITLVATPSLQGLTETTPGPIGSQAVALVSQQSPSPLLPALLTSYPLHAGHVYRLEITAADGSSVRIRGSWSQATMGGGGEIQTPLPEFFDGTTPFIVDVVSPLANPSLWSLSASASPQDLLGKPPVLVITVYDVTGTE